MGERKIVRNIMRYLSTKNDANKSITASKTIEPNLSKTIDPNASKTN